jgi:hypothetical protein
MQIPVETPLKVDLMKVFHIICFFIFWILVYATLLGLSHGKTSVLKETAKFNQSCVSYDNSSFSCAYCHNFDQDKTINKK